MNRVRSSVVAASGIALAVTVGVSACGSVQQLSAKSTVSKAMSSYQKATSAKFVLSLEATAADVSALGEADGDSPMSAKDLATLTKVLSGSLAVSVQAPTGKTFGDAKKSLSGLSFDTSAVTKDPQAYANSLKHSGCYELAVNYQGSTLTDLRMVNGVLYARADVPTILKLAGQSQTELNQALASLPPALAPIAKAARGEWVSVDVAGALPSLLKNVPTGDLPSPTASLDPATVQNLLTSLKSAYQKNATITQVGQGDRGTEYQLSAPIKQIATAVEPQLDALIGQAGDATGGTDTPSAAKVREQIAKLPNKSFTADVWVKNNELTGLSIDLAQFEATEPAGHQVVLNVAIAMNGGQVSVPSGATAIDVKALLQDFQSEVGGLTSAVGAGSSGRSGAAGGGLDVKALKQAGLSAAQIKQLEKEEKAYGK